MLEIYNIEKSFFNNKVLNNISFSVKDGEIHALLGENGAGKSTLMKILSGIYTADKGLIKIDNKQVSISDYGVARKLGISTIFQEMSLIPYLNVWQNVFLGREIKKNGFFDKRKMMYATRKLLEEIDVKIDIKKKISQLSIADKQFVEIIKALSVSSRILILDEPTATLTPESTEYLFSIMRTLKRKGVKMIFITHHLDEIFTLCDHVSVLRDGNLVTTLEIKNTTKHDLITAMVGRETSTLFPIKNKPSDKVALSVKNDDINFKVFEGEVLGLAGLIGSGRTELLEEIFGLRKGRNFEVSVYENIGYIKSFSDSYKLGIGFLPEDRKKTGIFPDFSVVKNATINNLSQGMLVNLTKESKKTQPLLDKLHLKYTGMNQMIKYLSGGNQQKVIIVRWLLTNCNILIFDEPTRGIDVGAKAEIYQIINDISKLGKSIIMISSEIEEIIGLSNRVMVMRANEISAILENKEDITATNIMAYAIS